jgi:protoporphyrinogen oxidase
MVPDPHKTCLGLEYFCFEGDGLWTMPDDELIKLATKELGMLGLVDPKDVEDGAVVRMPKAYPVYDSVYVEAVNTIREFVAGLGNLYLVGRNGMHKYNNQDHSMLTAMLSVKNILGANYDVWEVNVDNEYHEEVRETEGDDVSLVASTQPMVPKRIS